MSSVEIVPVTGPIDGTVKIPGSKSITNRALLMAALANGPSKLTGALFSDDTHYMSAALRTLGIPVSQDEAACSFTVQGHGACFPVHQADLFLGNAGTATRFLTAALCLSHGEFTVDGVARMRQRPIGDLLGALRSLGATIHAENECVPLRIKASGLNGGHVVIRGDASSQFLSALLIVAPLTRTGLNIEIDGPLYSKPYISMTLEMLRQWGAHAETHDLQTFTVPGNQAYSPQNYVIEPDASSASYFFAAAAVTGGRVRVENLGSGALQGDLDFVDVLQKMGAQVQKTATFTEVRGAPGGALSGIDVDMNAISDTVMTLAAIAPFASGPVNIRNVGHIRGKETDRLTALTTELQRLGVRVDEKSDGLTIYPESTLRPARIQTYEDHRMAMSFAITGLRSRGIEILDPGCTAKTFPDFFTRLESLRAGV